MKYWILTTEYPPFFGGGISTYCYHTSCMLSEQGHEVTVFVNAPTVKSFVIEQLKEARLVRFNPVFTKADLFLGETAMLSFEFADIVKRFVEKEGKPDMIECQDYNGIGYFLLQFRACLYEWCKNIPVVLTMHSPSFLYLEYNQVSIYKKPNFWIGEMERFCIQAADLVISPSQYLVDELKKRFEINTTNLHIVPNPYRFETPDTFAPPENFLSNNELTFYGKLSPQKGSFKILEQFKLLWDKGFKMPFTMIGGQEIVFHPQGKSMGEIIKQQYAPYINSGFLKLKDKINPQHRAKFLEGATIFIVPSIVDNLPYVVLELMSLGKVVIVSKQGGQAETVIDNNCGFIFDYDKADSFEKTLHNVVELSINERLSIARNAIKRIQTEYDYPRIYALKIKLIEDLKSNFQHPVKFPFIRTGLHPIPVEKSIQSITGLLSIVVPYYNLGKCIDDTIASVLNSTYKNIEIIIVNDGSTDPESNKKLDAYRRKDKITVIDKPNTGLANTRNFGAEKAKGEFLAFLDADDKVAKTYYERAIRILIHYSNVHFVGAWTKYFENSKSIWPTFNPEPPLLLVHNTINSSALVYKKDAFLMAGKNDEAFKIGLEDYESVINLKANGYNGVAIPEILFYYRVRKNSMIKNVDKTVRSSYYQKIAEKHREFFAFHEKEIKQLIASNGAPLSYDNSTLDELPFQRIPIIGKGVKKLIHIIKAKPALKTIVLRLKRLIQRQ